jgi:hypothetical protein
MFVADTISSVYDNGARRFARPERGFIEDNKETGASLPRNDLSLSFV